MIGRLVKGEIHTLIWYGSAVRNDFIEQFIPAAGIRLQPFVLFPGLGGSAKHRVEKAGVHIAEQKRHPVGMINIKGRRIIRGIGKNLAVDASGKHRTHEKRIAFNRL
jgi:hypothetical protein